MLKTTKMTYQEGYLKCDVFDGKTMDINLIYLGLRKSVGFKMFDKYIIIIHA